MRFFAAACALALAGSLVACIPEDDPTQAPAPRFGPDGQIPPPSKAPAASDIDEAHDDPSVPLSTDPKKLLATVEALKDRLKDRPRDFNVNAALGNLFYDNAKYIDAVEYFGDALKISASAEARLLDGADANPARVIPADCRLDVPSEEDLAQGQKTRAFEAVVKTADALMEAQPAGAAACLGQLRPLVASVHARRGNSWYLAGNPEMAKKDHAVALALDDGHAEALFFMGALTLELAGGDEATIEEGAAYWRRLLEIAPDHSRAEIVRSTLPQVQTLFGRRPEPGRIHPSQGEPVMPGATETASGGAPLAPLAPGVAEAMAKIELTPELHAELDGKIVQGEAYLEQKQWQKALDTFMPVMPVRPSARLALGMGIALRELGKPSAERVLVQSGRMPGADVARSSFELAVFYEKTNPAQAKSLYLELAGDPVLGAQVAERLAALK